MRVFPAARRLGITVVAVLAALPAAALGQHSKLALESIGPAGGNGAAPADVVGSRDAGQRVFLTTAERLTAADADSSLDLYARTGATTTLLSAGTSGGDGAFPANYGAALATGTRVVFQTDERLVSSDTDSSLDVYMREGSTTTLVSAGTGSGAGGAFDSLFAGASADGTHVFFVTRGSLAASDTDAALDVYERSAGNTTLVSTGPADANGPSGAELMHVSDDGTKAFFHTAGSLVAADTDSVQDVYQRAGGVTTLLSVGPGGGNGSDVAAYDGSSLDGSKVFFHTDESLLASDTDAGTDVYERSNGTTTIHSVGPSGGNSGAVAKLAGISRDGSKVFIESPEKLIASPVDRDTQPDVYESAGGTLRMLTPGGNDTVATPAYFAAASADGSRVFIRSEEGLAAGDTDAHQDIYEVDDGAGPARISIGPGGGNGPMHALFGGISDDGTYVFFETYESLQAADTDANTDVYERHAGATSLLSAEPGAGNEIFDATFRAVSADGRRVFFRTAESLLAGDTDNAADVYSANVPGTVTVVLNTIPDDPQDFSFTAGGGLSPASFKLDDDTDATLSNARTFGNLSPGSGYSVSQALPVGWSELSATCDNGSPVSNIDLGAGETVTCTFVDQRGYPRPKTATPFSVPLVPAYAQCVSANRMHGPTLLGPSCSPPVSSSLLTVGTPDANGAQTNMVGRARFRAMAGNPVSSADEADVGIRLNVSDVRRESSLADYAGQLQGTVMLRITDRLNGPSGNEVGTVNDLPLNVTVLCAATADDATGATCSANTSADAVLAGMVSESKRTVWGMGDVRVFDGGPDGQASTQNNSLFVKQGVFVP